MIYAFQILAPSGSYEGWAHSEDEMKQKFFHHPERDKLFDIDCYVFWTGGLPNFSYEEYALVLSALEIEHSSRGNGLFKIVEERINKAVDILLDMMTGEMSQEVSTIDESEVSVEETISDVLEQSYKG